MYFIEHCTIILYQLYVHIVHNILYYTHREIIPGTLYIIYCILPYTPRIVLKVCFSSVQIELPMQTGSYNLAAKGQSVAWKIQDKV